MNNASSGRTRPFATAFLLAALLALSACGKPVEEPPLAGAKIGGSFTLVDQDGRPVSDKQFAGQYRLFYFGYTYCPDVCPATLQKLMAGFRKFERQAPDRAARVQPVFISVDPRRDTPAIMKAYVAAFHPRLIGLTGSEPQIAAVAKSFAVYYKDQKPGGAAGYLVDHSSAPMLFGPDGAPMVLVAADQGEDAVLADLDRWVK